jgi:hypothetical protein
MLQLDELAPLGIGDDRSGFATHEQPPEVVPRPMGVDAAVDERVERAVRDRAQVERRRAERAELPPPQVARREA